MPSHSKNSPPANHAREGRHPSNLAQVSNHLSSTPRELHTPLEDNRWEIHARMARQLYRPFLGRNPMSGEFDRNGFHIGNLPESLVTQLKAALKLVPRGPIRPENHPPNYRIDETPERVVEGNRENVFYRLDQRPDKVLQALLRELAGPVSRCIASPWRPVNIRCWEMLTGDTGARDVGTASWHSDRYPDDVLKVLVYLTQVGPEQGTTELLDRQIRLQRVEGPAGQWLLFRNSVLPHRGIRPMHGSRLMLEITIVPAFWQRSRPVFAGDNAMYPVYPSPVYSILRLAHRTLQTVLHRLGRLSPWHLALRKTAQIRRMIRGIVLAILSRIKKTTRG